MVAVVIYINVALCKNTDEIPLLLI